MALRWRQAPAYEELGNRVVVLVDGPVQQRLGAATRSFRPAVGVAAVLDLQFMHKRL